MQRAHGENGHQVDVVNVCQKKIAGCLACEYCHKEDSGHERQCVQQDDMQEVYPLLDEAEMIVLASPVYYHSFSGQLQCAINRIYALDKPKRLKKAALILSSGSDHVYGGAIYEYQNSFLNTCIWRIWESSRLTVSRTSRRKSWKNYISSGKA